MDKQDVTNEFDIIAIERYVGFKDEPFKITLGNGHEYEITVKQTK